VSRLARKPFAIMVLMFLLMSLAGFALGTKSGWEEPKTIIVPDQYPTINEAIAHARDGDTIYVKAGIYYENVRVDKTLTLVGENVSTTIVDANRTNTPILLNAPYSTVTGFTFRRSQLKDTMFEPIFGGPYGVLLFFGCNVTGNIITDNGIGIYSWYGHDNIVSGNNITSNSIGVGLDLDTQSTIQENSISDNNVGISLSGSTHNRLISNEMADNGIGVFVGLSSNNSLLRNKITHSEIGIEFWFSTTNNTVEENSIAENRYGIEVLEASGNCIYHNNFVNNTYSADVSSDSANTWDDGYPSGGNYWSDHNGIDADHDGIGDTPYIIDADNHDNYPLIAPFHGFDAGTWGGVSCDVDIISNSTVSDFYFNPEEGPFLRFEVSGKNRTNGFCRVTIPKQLLSAEHGWVVLVNRRAVNYRLILDESRAYIYFFYDHSTWTVEIWGTHAVPEFALEPFLLLFMIVTALTAISLKRMKIAPFRTGISNYQTG